MNFDQGSHPSANDFLRRRGGELEETVFVDDKLPFVSGLSAAIDLCLLIRSLFEKISNYYRPHDGGSVNVCVDSFLTDNYDYTTGQIMQPTTAFIES